MTTHGAQVEAAIARETLERLELEVLGCVSGDTRAGLADKCAQAHAALGVLASSKPTETAHFARIDEAEKALRGAANNMAMAARTHADPRVGNGAEQLRELAENIAGARRRALEQAVVPTQSPYEEDPLEHPRRAASRGVPRSRALPMLALSATAARPTPTPVMTLPLSAGADLRQRLMQQTRRAMRGIADDDESADDTAATSQPRAGTGAELVTLRSPSAGTHTLDTRGKLGETAQLRHLARDCMEEIGTLGNNRYVADTEEWTPDVARSEDRLLANLDALVSLGRGGPVTVNVIAQLLDWAADGPAVAVFRPFARTFVLGCTAGHAPARAALRAMFASHPRTWRAQSRALALSASEHIDEVLTDMFTAAQPALLPHLLDAMCARRSVPHAKVAPFLRHTNEDVRGAAIVAMSVGSEATMIIEAMLDQLQREPDDALVMESIATLAVHDTVAARRALRERLSAEHHTPGTLSRPARERAVLMLAIIGERSDVELLLAVLANHPTDAGAVGWHGHATLISPLLALLEDDRATVRQGAARSLHRITGADLPALGQRLASPYRACTDPARWQAWLRDHDLLVGGDDVRIRLGQPFSMGHGAAELTSFFVPMAVRQTAAFELAVHSAGLLPDVRDWTAKQVAGLHACQQQGSVAPGRWLETRRHERQTSR